MNKLNKSWMAVVAAALLLGTLVGVVWARPHDRPQAQDITRKVNLTGGEFIPANEAQGWQNNGDYVSCDTGICSFFAPVVFPCLPSVTVERFIVYAEDNHATANLNAAMYRVYLPTKKQVYLGQAATPSGTAGYQPYNSGAINKTVWPSQRAFIHLWIGGPSIQVYGVTVEYHRNI
jgi:hypothetical protein